MAEDKFYGYETGKDFDKDVEYYLNNADEQYIAEHFDEYVACLEYQNEREKRISKEKIEKRRLNKKHEQEIKRVGFLSFLAGQAFIICLACVKPQFVGGEKIANRAYSIIREEGYGWRDNSQSGLIFNQGSEYISYEEAMDRMTSDLRSEEFTDPEIDVALSKLFNADPTMSTLEERNSAKRANYYESKLEEEKGKGL